jgi:cysteine-rich repeat protein
VNCKCKPGYAFDANQVCKDYCGDGQVIDSECDDGNTVSGDGCSSTCQI